MSADAFLAALQACAVTLSRGSPDRRQWERDAREAVLRVNAALDEIHEGGAKLKGLPGTCHVHSEIISFIHEELRRTYLHPETITALPAPASWVRRLQDFIADCGGSRTDTPAQYLTSWRAILVALGRKNNKEDREQVRHLNQHYAGPIVIPKQGAQPKVNREKLLAWWNALEVQWLVGESKARDAGPTVAARHPYGRTGEAVPEIGGGVRKRRKDRKP